MKDIPGYEGRYAATEDGVIWSLPGGKRSGHKLKPYPTSDGYMKVQLYRSGGVKCLFVHRLIAETFIPNPVGYSVVNHKDANPQNNRVSNLEWIDQSGNIKFSHRLGNQNKDRAVSITDILTGEVWKFPNMQEASVSLFGGKYILRGQFRRKGKRFVYRGKLVVIE